MADGAEKTPAQLAIVLSLSLSLPVFSVRLSEVANRVAVNKHEAIMVYLF